MSGYDRLRAEISRSGQSAAANLAQPRTGLVTSYDPDRYAVKVEIQPENVETGWLPILTLMSGQGWGVYFGPSKGDQALVIFLEGDGLAGVCVGFLPSDEDVPPRVEAGEIILAHKSESFIRLEAGGVIRSKGTWEHEGPITATEEITARSEGTSALLGALLDAYLAHRHTGVQTGGGSTGTTDTEPEG